MQNNKRKRVFRQSELRYVQVHHLRNYAEKLLEAFPKHFPDFEASDSYEVFFVSNKPRIALFRRYLIHVLYEALESVICKKDLGLIFRTDTDGISYLIRQKHGAYSMVPKILNSLKKELLAMHRPEHVYVSPDEQHYVFVSGTIDKEPWKSFVPKEYFIFADHLFRLVQDKTEISKEVLCRKGRSERSIVVVRDFFIYAFCRRYPEATERFFAHLLGRTNSSSIAHSFYRQFDYLNHVGVKNSEAGKLFQKLRAEINYQEIVIS